MLNPRLKEHFLSLNFHELILNYVVFLNHELIPKLSNFPNLYQFIIFVNRLSQRDLISLVHLLSYINQHSDKYP